jgi:hypothetical protein
MINKYLYQLLDRLFPADAVTFHGPLHVVYSLAVYNALMTMRSCIHMFKSDGGAQSIATIDCTVDGGNNIVALFAQWGASQLVLAAMIWIAIIYYQGLVPLMLVLCLLEHFLRVLAGMLKPMSSQKVPPENSIEDS